MKGRRPLSLAAVAVVALVLCWTRVEYTAYRGWTPLRVTSWDAFGYYQYLPSWCIYHDVECQDWVEHIDSTYHVVGGPLYQLTTLDNGNRATKYLGGIALMEWPFFQVAHWYAGHSGYKQDGFSPPYQWAMAAAPLFYGILALFLWRLVLLRYFRDAVAALVLVCCVLATNAIQYISVDGAQTHGFLLALYVLMLWATLKWHERPGVGWAAVMGATLGLAAVARPTEALMLFIPLLWNTGTKEAARVKWAQVRKHAWHLGVVVIAAFVMCIPQLRYWKRVTGSYVYDVGSKWDFLMPHGHVLFGFEKGWSIYTPITIAFVAGLFLLRGRAWRNSVLVFSLLNLWVITAWHDWRYGGSYSARALVQSYPVWSLAFAVLVERAFASRWRWPLVGACGYLLGVNLFQIKQYNNTVIHFDDMHRRYYQAIYLDADPTPEDVALLDDPRIPTSEDGLTAVPLYTSIDTTAIDTANTRRLLLDHVPVHRQAQGRIHWLKLEADLRVRKSQDGARCILQLDAPGFVNSTTHRLRPDASSFRRYVCYLAWPGRDAQGRLSFVVEGPGQLRVDVAHLRVTELDGPAARP